LSLLTPQTLVYSFLFDLKKHYATSLPTAPPQNIIMGSNEIPQKDVAWAIGEFVVFF